MLTAVRKPPNEDDGFTLIELMVVVLIVGILLAIAIPTFLGARDRANNRATESNLRSALTAEKTIYTDAEIYTGTDAAGISALRVLEPALSWTPPGVLTFNRQVSATVVTPPGGSVPSTVILQAQSASGRCFFIVDISAPGSPPGTYYSSEANACSTTIPNPPTSTVSLRNVDGNPNHWALAF